MKGLMIRMRTQPMNGITDRTIVMMPKMKLITQSTISAMMYGIHPMVRIISVIFENRIPSRMLPVRANRTDPR